MVARQCLQFMSGTWKVRSPGSVISSSGGPGSRVIWTRSSSRTKVSTYAATTPGCTLNRCPSMTCVIWPRHRGCSLSGSSAYCLAMRSRSWWYFRTACGDRQPFSPVALAITAWAWAMVASFIARSIATVSAV